MAIEAALGIEPLKEGALDLVWAYGRALAIRLFEEKVDWLLARGHIGGTTHLCIGQEAVAVGVVSALDRGDYIVSNHRGHGHLIARGADLRRLFAELMGRKTGYCMGRGGTQHTCAMGLNFLGTNGITGGGIPIGTGAGLSIRLSGAGRVAAVFFGDGASNQGVFHECLNMASVWRLPVLYVCENNLYGMSTRFSAVSRFEDVALRGASFGIPSFIVDGMDAAAVHGTALKAVERVRGGGGPALIEAKTYRYSGHSKSDPRAYRSKDEEAEWKGRDPVALLERLVAGAFGAAEAARIRAETASAVEKAAEEAMADALPAAEEALDGAYAQSEAHLQGSR